MTSQNQERLCEVFLWLPGLSLAEFLSESVLTKKSEEVAAIQHLPLKLWIRG